MGEEEALNVCGRKRRLANCPAHRRPAASAPVSCALLLLASASGSGSMSAQQNLQRRALTGTSLAHSGHSPAGRAAGGEAAVKARRQPGRPLVSRS